MPQRFETPTALAPNRQIRPARSINYGACSLLDIQDNHVRQPVLWGYGQDFLVCSFGGGGGGKTCALLACSPQLPASVELWFDSPLRQF